MKKPEVIMHNSVSLDGRVTGFEVNMGLHYGIVGGFGAGVYMAGSKTARTGVEMAGGVPAETAADFTKPDKGAGLSYWVIPDTRGSLKGMLHAFRGYEFCRDVIVLISGRTNRDYIDYLEKRNYDYLVCGDDFVNYEQAFESLGTKYGVKRILVDTGPTLGAILLKQGLVDKISLLVHPCLAGNKAPGMFEKLELESNILLKLEKQETPEDNYLHTVWQVTRAEKK